MIDAESLTMWRSREAELDASDMRALVAGFPAHIEDALASATPIARQVAVDFGSVAEVAAVGMGGSAIGTDLVAAYTADRRRTPVHVVRGYDLPAWLDEDALVLVCSYSGNTEETIACYESARDRGLRVIAITTGGTVGDMAVERGDPVVPLPDGFPPRAALGHALPAAALVLAAVDPGLDLDAETEALSRAARRIAPRTAEWLAWNPENPALQVATSIDGALPVIYAGHAISAAAARRWQGQFAENAKTPAFVAELPEHNHNQIVALEGRNPVLKRFALLHLETPWDAPRVRERFDFVVRFSAGKIGRQHRILAAGDDPVESTLWLCHLGDCASFLLSVVAGHDPTPVASIDALKTELKG